MGAVLGMTNPLVAGVRDWLFQAVNSVDNLRSHLLEFKFKPKATITKGLVYHERAELRDDDLVGQLFIQPSIEDAQGQLSLAFVTGVQESYGLKKANTSASLGLSAIGSLSIPLNSSSDSMVKVGVETISEESFYDGFFSLLQQYLNEKPRRTAWTARCVARRGQRLCTRAP